MYNPSTLPGHHLAHAWLERNRRRRSARDLARKEKLVVVANDAAWKAIQHDDQMVNVEIIGTGNEDRKDVDGRWKDVCGVGEKGAVMVRPDGIVSYRWQDDSILRSKNLQADTKKLIDRILKRT